MTESDTSVSFSDCFLCVDNGNFVTRPPCEPNSQLNCVNRSARYWWRLGPRKTGLTPQALLLAVPSGTFLAVSFVLCLMLFNYLILNVLILTLLCVRFVCFSKDGWVTTCLGKSYWLGLSPVILLYVGMCLSIFPFDVWDKLWVLIWSVSELSLIYDKRDDSNFPIDNLPVLSSNIFL